MIIADFGRGRQGHAKMPSIMAASTVGGDLRRRIGQLLWVGFDGLEPPPALLQRIARSEAGAAIVFGRNLASPADLVGQAADLCRALHEAAPREAPLLVAVDQEGGRVQRLRAPLTVWPPMLRLGEHAVRDPAAARALSQAVGRALGDELAALGFDLDFAPVLDVHTNPANPVIGDRAFANDAEQVIALAGAFVQGLSEAGILGCGKHFPGHGDTHLDSHLALPRVDHPVERLHAVELAPFRALIDLPLFMTAHVIFSALDSEVPATLSARVIAGLLRGELGYRGVVVSDDLEMKAIADHFGIVEAMTTALLAGCDAFLLCHGEELQHQAFEAMIQAAERSSEIRARIVESAHRVAALKRRPFRGRPPLEVIGCPAHHDLADRMDASERPSP
jgi:beta-N-acetylhexosaminidase